MVSLPAELLNDICSRILSTWQLKALSQTCSRLRPHAQALLFRRVDVHDKAARERYLLQDRNLRRYLKEDPNYDFSSPSKHVNDDTTFNVFREAIAFNPNLGKCVRALSISMCWDISWNHIEELLPDLSNLEYLVIETSYELGSEGIQEDPRFPECSLRIKEFRSLGVAVNWSLVRFLELQPDLVRWDISDSSIAQDISSPFFARLTHHSLRMSLGRWEDPREQMLKLNFRGMSSG